MYRKVIYKTTGFSTGESEIAHGISNIDEIISIKGSTYRKSGDWEPLPAVPPANFLSQWEISVYDFNATRYRMFIGSSLIGSNVLMKMYIIVEYTKTTD